MNILQISSNAITGGAARVMYRLHHGFRKRGHHATIFAQWREIDEENIYCIGQIDDRSRSANRIARVAARIADKAIGETRFYHATSRILDSALFKSADVIQFHNLHGGFFNYKIISEFAASKPIVWTLHDMWAFTGHCAYAYDCMRWQTGCHTCPQIRGDRRQWAEPTPTWMDRSAQNWQRKQTLYHQSQLHIVTPSEWLRNLVSMSILSDAASIRGIPNGIDIDTFRPLDRLQIRRELHLPANASVILFAADRIESRRKGFPLLLQALQRLKTPESIVLLTVGHNRMHKSALQGFQRRDFGRVDDEAQLARLYNAADLFILPSLADNQPLVLLESLACGTPVVAFAVGGIPEMIEPERTGFLASPGDVAELAVGIETILAEDDLRARMRQNCRDLAVHKYDLEMQIDHYLAVYEQAITMRD